MGRSPFFDLACRDVFEGVMGSSEAFVARLVERCRTVRRLFQRGKMFSHATHMAKSDDQLVLKLTSASCSTRFSTSQFVEFRKLLESLPLFIKTFREFKYIQTQEYIIAGQDFFV